MTSTMASRASKQLLGRLTRNRLYSTNAKTKMTDLKQQAPKVTRLQNGVTVASIENYSPIARVGVIVNAGSRFETPEDLGLTHVLRAGAGLSTKGSTNFSITRNIQQIGGSFMCTGTREYIVYHVDCRRDDLTTSVKFLRDVTTAPAFKPWEVDDLKAKLTYDLAYLDSQPNQKMNELLHEAAFRDTLGRSLYCQDHLVNRYNSEQLMHYVQQYYSSGRIALIGLGVDHIQLAELGNYFTPFTTLTPVTKKATFHGDELRKRTSSPLTYASMVVQGPSLTGDDALIAGVLQYCLGGPPSIKYAPGNTRLNQAVAKVTQNPFSVTGLNSQYTDAGMLGFSVICNPQDAANVLQAAYSQLAAVTRGTISEAEVTLAKTQFKSRVAMAGEDSELVLLDLGEQALGSDDIFTTEDIMKRIDTITHSKVVNAAEKLKLNKVAMSAVGDLSNTPYLDELSPK